jgi:hypothetical protein
MPRALDSAEVARDRRLSHPLPPTTAQPGPLIRRPGRLLYPQGFIRPQLTLNQAQLKPQTLAPLLQLHTISIG